MRAIMLLAMVLMLTMAGCSAERTSTGRKMSQRDRDSTLAEQPLPGARVVARALKVTDRLDARTARVNADLDSLPH